MTAPRELTVVLIGNPNTGKSTLFTALSGMHTRIANFPGCTVEKKLGLFTDAGVKITLVDLPGTYSLSPRSLDEMVSVDVLLGRQADVGKIDAVICIVDAANIERNLYLYTQVREIGLPVILCLNMWDLAQERGIKVDREALSQRLGVPIVATSAHKNLGVQELKAAIHRVVGTSVDVRRPEFPAPFYEEIDHLRAWMQQKYGKSPEPFLLERMLLDVGGESEKKLSLALSPELLPVLASARERLAQKGCRVPAIETKVRYQWIREQLTGVVDRTSPSNRVTTSDRIDKVLTHKVTGLLVFIGVMFLIFQSIYAWAAPFMDAIESVQEMAAGWVESSMAPGTLRSLIVDGVIGGVGSVVIFVPQIALLFLFIAILEDCGYMSRAAFLMDKLMTKLGLSGKSFVPLMSSFACAVPGVMAARVIENRQDRLLTILVAPLMSCSARLPVYLLMIAAFVPQVRVAKIIPLQGLVLFAMYCVGALVAIPVAWILRKFVFKGETPPFVMELPSYKWPSPRIVLHRVYDRVKAFVLRAGTLIFCTTVLVWAAAYFPEDHTPELKIQSEISQLEEAAGESPTPEQSAQLDQLQEQAHQISGRLLADSYLGRSGRLIEPVVRPLGWDWRIGVSVIASFPAREVVLATLGTIFSLGSEVADDGEENQNRFVSALQNSKWPDGRPLFTIPVAVSIMVFFALCAQCAATLMIIRRETNSWRWPIVTFVYMTGLAYVAAFVVYQVGRLL
ncbi:MAG: ferrous iron transport protein B [Planctomycetota bacterium]|nr:MAG: ferrous iron transport protein B [Planctomycetota bacterium]